TFLIEKGKVTRPVHNMRYTESILSAFNCIEKISKVRKTAQGFFAGSFIVPAIKISKFNFSSASLF
ncbi:MAG: metallopeptidase TldD-related protein, partial [bacterium]